MTSSQTHLFDLVVIGSGPAGQRAALQGAKAGKKVALVEEYSAVGGGCVHFGTLPSKSFRESVYRYSLSARGALSQEMGQASKTRKGKAMPQMARLLQRRNRVVFEPYCGSGTTMLAAETLGRRCLAIELAPEYVDLAVRRWQTFTKMPATLQATGKSFDQVARERSKKRAA